MTIVPPPSPDWAAERAARGSFFVVEPDRARLTEIARLIDTGAIRPIVEAILPLAEARGAYERGQREHPRGRLVLSVSEDM